MGVDRIQSVRKVTKPQMTLVDNDCPVAYLADDAQAIIEAANRIYKAQGKAQNERRKLGAESKGKSADYTLICRNDELGRMAAELEERLGLLEAMAAKKRTKSAEGALFQLSLMFADAMKIGCEDELSGEQKAAALDRITDLAFSLRHWIIEAHRLTPDEFLDTRYLGGVDPHKTFENAIGFTQGASIPDDSVPPFKKAAD